MGEVRGEQLLSSRASKIIGQLTTGQYNFSNLALNICKGNFEMQCKFYTFQWRIQDFPEGVRQLLEGERQHTIWPFFPKNCMKMKKFWSRGRPRVPCVLQIRHCILICIESSNTYYYILYTYLYILNEIFLTGAQISLLLSLYPIRLDASVMREILCVAASLNDTAVYCHRFCCYDYLSISFARFTGKQKCGAL